MLPLSMSGMMMMLIISRPGPRRKSTLPSAAAHRMQQVPTAVRRTFTVSGVALCHKRTARMSASVATPRAWTLRTAASSSSVSCAPQQHSSNGSEARLLVRRRHVCVSAGLGVRHLPICCRTH